MGTRESDGLLDAYSAAVVRVARTVLPSAAGLQVGQLVVAGLGVGLAVPVDATTRGLITTLMTHGRVRRAGFGIVGAQAPLPPAIAQRLGRRTGLHVADVVAGSPAATAGLRRGDVVVAIDGGTVATTTEIQRLMVAGAIGRRMEVTVWRNGALVDVIALPRELTDA